ncbi:MAG: hypothetical protein ABI995_15235 [Acidobacteriota bacterium]
MSTTVATPQQRRTALIAVALATMIQVVGQILIKRGADALGPSPSLAETAIGMVTILPLFCGYAMYGLFTVIMVFALRHGELSMLYPIMALSYVWVSIVSVVVFHEPISALQMIGVGVIVSGVAVLGRGSQTA